LTTIESAESDVVDDGVTEEKSGQRRMQERIALMRESRVP
jgi:hypothetical protein